MEPKGREWLLALCNKPSTKRNGPDVVAMNKAVNALYDEREHLIAQNIGLCKLLRENNIHNTDSRECWCDPIIEAPNVRVQATGDDSSARSPATKC